MNKQIFSDMRTQLVPSIDTEQKIIDIALSSERTVADMTERTAFSDNKGIYVRSRSIGLVIAAVMVLAVGVGAFLLHSRTAKIDAVPAGYSAEQIDDISRALAASKLLYTDDRSFAVGSWEVTPFEEFEKLTDGFLGQKTLYSDEGNEVCLQKYSFGTVEIGIKLCHGYYYDMQNSEKMEYNNISGVYLIARDNTFCVPLKPLLCPAAEPPEDIHPAYKGYAQMLYYWNKVKGSLRIDGVHNVMGEPDESADGFDRYYFDNVIFGVRYLKNGWIDEFCCFDSRLDRWRRINPADIAFMDDGIDLNKIKAADQASYNDFLRDYAERIAEIQEEFNF